MNINCFDVTLYFGLLVHRTLVLNSAIQVHLKITQNMNTRIFMDIINVINVNLWKHVVLTELYSLMVMSFSDLDWISKSCQHQAVVKI